MPTLLDLGSGFWPLGASGGNFNTIGNLGNVTPSRFATVRYNNPGGMYPGTAARMFGTTGTGTIGGGHKIANFPTPVHGAAANMQNIVSGGYVGLPVSAAISKWSGGGRGTVPGFDPNQRITPEMTRDPSFMIPFMKAVASGEAPGRYPLSDEQWRQAYTWYATGKPEGEALPGGWQTTVGTATPTSTGGVGYTRQYSPPSVPAPGPRGWGDILADVARNFEWKQAPQVKLDTTNPLGEQQPIRFAPIGGQGAVGTFR